MPAFRQSRKIELEHTLDRDDRAIQNGSDRPFRDDRPTFV
jgi:hypothetical protein